MIPGHVLHFSNRIRQKAPQNFTVMGLTACEASAGAGREVDAVGAMRATEDPLEQPGSCSGPRMLSSMSLCRGGGGILTEQRQTVLVTCITSETCGLLWLYSERDAER